MPYRYSRAAFLNPTTGDPPSFGSTYKRPTFAKTLKRIAAKGADEIYSEGGETGKNLVKDIQEAGGIITMEDLIDYK